MTVSLQVPEAAAVIAGDSRDLTVPAEDGYALAATLLEPGRVLPDAPLVVMGCAVGVPRRYYAKFAGHIAARGHPVLTFDYRGIGGSRQGSLVGSKVRMRDWCILDVPGVLAWTQRELPRRPVHWIGHSMGGFATGLAHNNHIVARQLNVATLSGYWGRMSSPEKYRVRLMMAGLGAPVVRLMGYFPGFLLGGEDMPGPAYLEWTRWCMTPGFLFDDTTLAERANFPRFKAPLRCVQIADDPWGTEAAVGHMTEHFTGSADRSTWRITPADAGVKAIGHFGFFRSEMADALWKPAADWLLDQESG